MSTYDYNKKACRYKRGLLWMIGTVIHYVFIAVFSVLALVAVFCLFVGMFQMDFSSSWDVWWKSADDALVGTVMVGTVAWVWSIYNTIRRSYLNEYLDSGSFGVVILTLKFPFLVIGALIFGFLKFISALPDSKKKDPVTEAVHEAYEWACYDDYVKQQEQNS